MALILNLGVLGFIPNRNGKIEYGTVLTVEKTQAHIPESDVNKEVTTLIGLILARRAINHKTLAISQWTRQITIFFFLLFRCTVNNKKKATRLKFRGSGSSMVKMLDIAKLPLLGP